MVNGFTLVVLLLSRYKSARIHTCVSINRLIPIDAIFGVRCKKVNAVNNLRKAAAPPSAILPTAVITEHIRPSLHRERETFVGAPI